MHAHAPMENAMVVRNPGVENEKILSLLNENTRREISSEGFPL